jgi:XTP/dITP diphosphohydrolase
LVRLYLISRNPGKVSELRKLGSYFGIEIVPLDLPKVEVQSESLEEVSLFSAVNAFLTLRKPLIVEDSGLYIEALNLFPGAYSSFVYKTIGIRGILKLLEGVENRRAYFKSVIALAAPNVPEVRLFTGVVHGVIATEPRGLRGFGFDPIFVPEGSAKTFAEMEEDEKNRVSHRGKAFRELASWLLDNCARVACHSWT